MSGSITRGFRLGTFLGEQLLSTCSLPRQLVSLSSLSHGPHVIQNSGVFAFLGVRFLTSRPADLQEEDDAQHAGGWRGGAFNPQDFPPQRVRVGGQSLWSWLDIMRCEEEVGSVVVGAEGVGDNHTTHPTKN